MNRRNVVPSLAGLVVVPGVSTGFRTATSTRMPWSILLGLMLAGLAQAQTYTLSTSATNGTIWVDPNEESYASGTVVTLVATPKPGYMHDAWTGDVDAAEQPKGRNTRQIKVTMDGNKSITATFKTWEAPLGVPDPPFGIFETYRMYDTPANRNPALTYFESASGGYYTHYVDFDRGNDSTAGTGGRGTEALPRLTFPDTNTILAGSVIEVHGTVSNSDGNWEARAGAGTEQHPIFIRGVGYPRLYNHNFRMAGATVASYTVLEGFEFEHSTLGTHSDRAAHHIAIRDCVVHDYPPPAGSVGIASGNGGNQEYLLVYGCHIYNMGDCHYPSENDFHATCTSTSAGGYPAHVWVMDNHMHHNGGDSFQLNSQPGNLAHHIYVGRNVMHHEGENGVDLKEGEDVIISENLVYEMCNEHGSDEIVINEDAPQTRYWIIFNEVYGGDASGGIRCNGDAYIIGNVVYNCKGSNTYGIGGGGTGVTIQAFHNTIYNCDRGLALGGGADGSETYLYAYNNLIADISMRGLYAYIERSYTASISQFDNNLIYEPSGAGGDVISWGWNTSSHTETLSQFQARTGKGEGCVEANPGFVDASHHDFHLQPTSPAIDTATSGGVVQQVFDTFVQLYGLDIRQDMEGRTRPQGLAWDIGAYEYTSGSSSDTTPPGDVSGLTATPGDGSISLTWTNPTDADFAGVRILRKTGSAPTGPTDGTVVHQGAGTSQADMGLTNGTTYYYRAFTYDAVLNYSSGVTANGTPGGDSTPPGDVSGLTATAGDTQISLSWTNPPDADLAGVRILRKTGSAPTSPTDGTVAYQGTGTSQVDTGLTNGTTYYYRAFAYDEVPNYSSGVTASATPVAPGGDGTPPGNVSGFTATPGDGQVSLSWTNPTDADFAGVRILRKTGSAPTSPTDGTLVHQGTGTSQVDTGLANGTTYYYGAFTYDAMPNYSSGVTVSGTPGVSDQIPPSAQVVHPAVDAQVPLNPLIILTISDAGSGIEASTVTIQVNNQLVYSGGNSLYESAYGTCRRTGTRANYHYYYHPANTFDFDQQVTVLVNASDATNNTMTPLSYQFTTQMRSFGQNQPVSSESDTSGRPVVATDSQGNLWAAWHAGQANARDIYVAKRGGQLQQWNTPLRLISVASDRCNPALAIGPDNALYLAWQDNRRGNWDIYVSVSADGSTWGDPTRVTDSNDTQANPVIAVDQASPYHVYIAWERGTTGSRDLYLATCSSSFVSKTIAQVTSDPADQAELALAVGSDNTVYLLWTELRSGLTHIYGSSSAASSWSNIAVVTGSGNQSHPAVTAAPGTSTLHVAWQSDAAGNLDVLYGTSDGLPANALTGSTLIDPLTGGAQFAPSIMAVRDHANNVHVYACWQDSRNVPDTGDSDLYVAEIRSGTGGTNILVGDDETNSNQSEPALGFDEYGQPVVVWTDSRSSTPRIYSAASMYFKPVALASALVTRAAGGRVGVDPAAINDATDVSIQLPASAYDCDVTVSLSEIQNLPKFTVVGLTGYEIGPSGAEFTFPATVTIPYTSTGSGRATPYWYDPQTGTLSQQGMTEITNQTLGNGIPLVSFKTNHLTTFVLLESPLANGGSGGGGGCAISNSREGSMVGFLLPYTALVLFLGFLKWKDGRGRKDTEDIRFP